MGGFGTGGLPRKGGALCRLLVLEHRGPGWVFGTWRDWLEEVRGEKIDDG